MLTKESHSVVVQAEENWETVLQVEESRTLVAQPITTGASIVAHHPSRERDSEETQALNRADQFLMFSNTSSTVARGKFIPMDASSPPQNMDSATVHAGTKCRLEVLEQQREGFRHGHQKPLSIYKQLTKGADGACRDDAGKMKPAVVLWLSEFFPTMCSCSPLNTVDKNGQGFAHSLTGYPPVLANMTGMTIRDRHPKFLATAMSWPRFLYSKYTDDSKNLEKGFLQGTLLLKAYKFIFTSPTSARDVKDNKCGPPSSPSQTSQTFTSQLHKGTCSFTT
ncbi:hypothetical protein SERLADRAFT_433019 [Serpula lacrymans var. lacrymans S7.9]|uniref:Uncharacterized protein n=1 Tax=Serpula lacrymans var. lacrymans (strain S7.9) TaxID=578457 RepID=F8NIX1_SERL9|nr:uncharacterized protein SERLADRAFT_433019 [Serpula lacrymans var. lacrymans S7.9]EGO29004.1 hypothetical protein SERLADRAFT_433019 [Serpula lacrymans var. lacrymans S7.9]